MSKETYLFVDNVLDRAAVHHKSLVQAIQDRVWVSLATYPRGGLCPGRHG